MAQGYGARGKGVNAAPGPIPARGSTPRLDAMGARG